MIMKIVLKKNFYYFIAGSAVPIHIYRKTYNFRISTEYLYIQTDILNSLFIHIILFNIGN